MGEEEVGGEARVREGLERREGQAPARALLLRASPRHKAARRGGSWEQPPAAPHPRVPHAAVALGPHRVRVPALASSRASVYHGLAGRALAGEHVAVAALDRGSAVRARRAVALARPVLSGLARDGRLGAQRRQRLAALHGQPVRARHCQ
eukprot:3053447-Rhodomonas_salina.1